MHSWHTDYPVVESMADGDLSELANEFEAKYNLPIKLISLDIKNTTDIYDDHNAGYFDGLEEDVYAFEDTYDIQAVFDINGIEVLLLTDYFYDGEQNDWFAGVVEPEDLYERYLSQSKAVNSNSKLDIKAASILAAEDDPFSDMDFDEDEELNDESAMMSETSSDDVTDTLDDMADKLDEMNDALKDFEEDDIDIELENNISDHYIAECEKCHGVFITAITSSDQEIEKISGVCPLCDSECDQYLKWVIQEI